jgi:predicted NUDIX family phosphoesterase
MPIIQQRKKHYEHILALRSEVLSSSADSLIVHKISNEDLIIGQRKFLETSTLFRQLIPYTLIRHNGSYFAYGRNSSGGESRLHGKLSIGVGGHIDLSDVQVDAFSGIDLERTISVSLSRELDEEISIDGEIISIQTMPHLICSSASEVDKVHLGLVSVIEIDSPNIRTKEDALIPAGLMTEAELLSGKYELEYWSKLALESVSRGSTNK